MPTKLPQDYVERVYAGWLGKVIGVRHGSDIEGWSYDTIRAVYGEVEGYLFNFKNFAADDDTNGSYFFVRALDDFTPTPALTAAQIADTWLNYAPYEHGFYWWGGYGISTEHTAYLNLRSGIPAPRSGSIEQNGAAVAEQIGGQIFIDAWGLCIPCNHHLAAEYARKAASVAHDGNAIYGGMFIAAAVSAAFCHSSIGEVIDCGLQVIPEDSAYARVLRDVARFHSEHPGSWRRCFDYVRANYGYDRYPGACHIIPNAAVIMLALLYGEGDFSRSINICNMCGWDTDCNVANVGTILGVLRGLDGIDDGWRQPVNDLLISSSVLGCLNILDIAGCAYYLASLGYRVAGEEPPARFAESLRRGERCYDFELPGATHSFRIATKGGAIPSLRNTGAAAHSGSRSLQLSAKLHSPGDTLDAYLQTYYRPADFDDSRYDPSFSPIVYPGQRLEATIMADPLCACPLTACLFVRDGNSGEEYCSAPFRLTPGEWQRAAWQIPALEGACLERAGLRLCCAGGTNNSEKLVLAYLDSFSMDGPPNYSLDFSKETMEHWNSRHIEVSQFSYLKGLWRIEGDSLWGSCADFGAAYTGDVRWKDYIVEAGLRPVVGADHRLLFRVAGAQRGYAVSLAEGGKLSLLKNTSGWHTLAQADFCWRHGQEYQLRVVAAGPDITVSCDGHTLIRYRDTDAPWLGGCVGFGVEGGSRCGFRALTLLPTDSIASNS